MHRRWRSLLCLALALVCFAARADDLEQLRSTYRQAQELFKDRQRESSPLPSGQTWSEGAQYSDDAARAAEAARQRLAEVEAQLGRLEPATRAYLERVTSPEERQTLEGLLGAIGRLYRDARAQQAAIEARLAELQGRMAVHRERLRELDLEEEALGIEAAQLRASLDDLRNASNQTRERVRALEGVLGSVESLDGELTEAAASARSRYWGAVGELFARLDAGKPRDYTPPIEAAPATTQRRVRRRSTRPEPIAPIPMPVWPVAPVALPAQPMAVPVPIAAASPSTAAPFDQAMDAWLHTATALTREQREAERLVQAVDSTEKVIHQRLESLEARRPAVERQRSEVEEARHELIGLTSRLESLHARVPAGLHDAFRQLREGIFWATAQEGLSAFLAGVEAHEQLAAHFIWVMKSYTTLLEKDLPTAVEILGPHPSDEAIEKFERLTHLTELYVTDREVSLALTQLMGRPAERPAPVPKPAAVEPSRAKVEQEMLATFKEILRQKRLGVDPARGGIFDPDEMRGALRMERVIGGQLIRSEHRGQDYVRQSDRKFTVDLMSGDLGPQYTLEALENSLHKHLRTKQGISRVGIRVDSPEGIARLEEIQRLVDSLPPEERQRVKILPP